MHPDERDLDDEIRGHLALSIKERIDRGEDPGQVVEPDPGRGEAFAGFDQQGVPPFDSRPVGMIGIEGDRALEVRERGRFITDEEMELAGLVSRTRDGRSRGRLPAGCRRRWSHLAVTYAPRGR